MPSTYLEGRPENTSWSYDRATYHGVKAQGSKGSLYQSHNTEAYVQKSRIFIGFSSGCLSVSAAQIAKFVDLNHLSNDNS